MLYVPVRQQKIKSKNKKAGQVQALPRFYLCKLQHDQAAIAALT